MNKKFLITKKVDMTRVFQPDGKAVAVTVLAADPCVVTQVRSKEKDGYTAIQLGAGKKRVLRKPQAGHTKGLQQFRTLREFRVDSIDGIERGQTFDVSQFQIGDVIKVTGTTRGRGFSGVVRRHGFHGSPASHGHKDQLRMPGSIGSTAPQRVFKGMRMAGQMGNVQVSVRKLTVVAIDAENNKLMVKGAVPGARNGIILVTAQ